VVASVIVTRYPRHPSGFTTLTDDQGITHGETLTCIHCARIWQVTPGSGKERGYCLKCGGPTCGAKACDRCLPFEKQIEIIEQRHALYRAMEER